MLPPFFQTYKNLLLQTSLSLSLTFLLTLLKIPIYFLHGLHTYIHPDHAPQNAASKPGIRTAIRRPSDSDSTNPELKKRNKSKEKFEFDENNAQIFRLRLDEAHLQTRLFFNEYHNSFVLSFVAISSMLLYKYLGKSNSESESGSGSGVLANGNLIPIVFAIVSLCRVFASLARVSFEKSGSKRSEKQFSAIIGGFWFFLGIVICFGLIPSIFDFDFSSVDVFWRILIAAFVGLLAGILYIPSGKNARSFWLGTDQIRSSLSIVSCGWFERGILYANYMLSVFTALLWINPFAEMLINKNTDDASIGNAEYLAGNLGFSHSSFTNFRLLCLLLSGIVQIAALRPNLQMFLNEAVLSWYQRLHASKVPDLDFSRAKVFLHNHFLCLALVQFFAPPLLVLIFLGLSQIDCSLFDKYVVFCGVVSCSVFVKEIALFMAWSIVFTSAVLTSASLVFYRRGTLYVS